MNVIHTPVLLARIPNEWRWARLQDLCSIFDCPHSTPDLAENGPYLARSQDIRTGLFAIDSAAHVSEQIYLERTARAVPSHGDLLFSREGTYFGIAAEIPPNIKLCLGQRMVLLRPTSQKLDCRFLKYWLNSPVMVRHMRGLREGSVAERLNVPTIKSLPVILPPIHEQKVIALSLSKLDAKIELNQRMNETLESITRAIFKSWFVDFDPVYAKANGQQQVRMTGENLFPALFFRSPFGQIPVGWQISPIGELTRVVGGSTPRTEEQSYWQDGQIAWATPKDLASLDSPVLLDTERHITRKGLEQIGSGLLPKGAVLLSSRAPIGYLVVSEIPVAINQGLIGLVCNRELPNHFVLNWIRSNLETIKAYANGTTFLEISKSSFRSLQLVVPPPAILQEFSRTVRPLYDRIAANLRENNILAETRNSLLPKLISGELRLGEP